MDLFRKRCSALIVLCVFLSLQSAWSYSLLFSSNRQGEIEPCGCQGHPLGGLQRLKAFVDRARKDAPSAVFVEAGDLFFPYAEISSFDAETEKRKAEMIARAYALTAPTVANVGERDLAAGVDGLKKLQALSRMRLISSNLLTPSGTPIFDRSAVVSIDGVKVGFVGLLTPNDSVTAQGVRVDAPSKALKIALAEAKGRGAKHFILLSNLGADVDRDLAKAFPGLSGIVSSRSLDVFEQPLKVGNTWIVQTKFQGQQAGELRIGTTGVAEQRLVDLDESYEEKNAVSALVAEYKSDVKQRAVNADKKELAPGKEPFVAAPFVCKKCHAKQYEWWKSTKHASAYLVLFAKDQHFDPTCIGCHSVGFDDPNGFQKIASPWVLENVPEATNAAEPYIEKVMKDVFGEEIKKGPLDSRVQPERYKQLKAKYHQRIDRLVDEGKVKKLYIGVQCEHCHLNRHVHLETGKRVESSAERAAKMESRCRTCHQPPNAPVFHKASIKKIGCPR